MQNRSRLGMRLVTVLMLLSLTLPCAAAERRLAVGDVFPALAGESLDDRSVQLPDATSGKVTLVILTFSRGAGERSMAWTDRFAKDFPDDSRVASYSVAMLSGAPGFIRGRIRSSMRKQTSERLRPKTLTVSASDKPWRERAGVGDDKLPYLLLLDAKGRVVWMYAGDFSPVRFEELKMRVSELLKGKQAR